MFALLLNFSFEPHSHTITEEWLCLQGNPEHLAKGRAPSSPGCMKNRRSRWLSQHWEFLCFPAAQRWKGHLDVRVTFPASPHRRLAHPLSSLAHFPLPCYRTYLKSFPFNETHFKLNRFTTMFTLYVDKLVCHITFYYPHQRVSNEHYQCIWSHFCCKLSACSQLWILSW